MAVGGNSGQNDDKSVTVNVRLKSTGESHRPTLANYSNVSLAQGLAYVDFGFLEPGLLSAVAQRAQNGEAVPPQLEGTRTARVALPVDAVLRLHRQLQQMVAGLQPAKSKLL
jgi:hypothetical protein